MADIIRTTLGPRAMLKMLLGAFVDDGSICRLGNGTVLDGPAEFDIRGY